VVVDVQEAFRGRIVGFDAVARRCGFLIEVASALDLPVVACEQNPGKLGPSAVEVRNALGDRPIVSKLDFDAVQEPAFVSALDPLRDQVIVAGIEAHVCVQQTVLGLRRLGRAVYLVVDAVGSQRSSDAEIAIQRMVGSGAIPVSAESVAFELLGSSAHAGFRHLLAPIVAGLAADGVGRAGTWVNPP